MSRHAPLSPEAVFRELEHRPCWSGDTSQIFRTVESLSFLTGIDLVRQVGVVAEAMNHHPDIDIRWRRITFVLTTHDSGGITDLDITLARRIDRLVSLI